MATQGGGFFSNFFNGGGGGIEHNGGGGGGRATPLPTASPQQQLSTGTSAPAGAGGAPASAPAPAPDPLNSHLESMQSVWQTATTPDGKPLAPQQDPLSQQMLTFKPEDVRTAADKLDFTANINPERVTAALGGDVAAFMECINSATRTAFAASTINAGQMLNQSFDKYGRAIDQALPTRLRNHEIANRNSDDPVLSHPAVAPIILAMKSTIAQQQPNMTPEQVQAAAENYVKGLGGAFNLQEATKVEKKQEAGATDWMKWANMG